MERIVFYYYNFISQSIFERLLFNESKSEENHLKQINNLIVEEGYSKDESWKVFLNLSDITIGFWGEGKVNIVHVDKVIIKANHSGWMWVESNFFGISQNFLVIQNRNITFELKGIKTNFKWDQDLNKQYNELYKEFYNSITWNILFIIPIGSAKLLKYKEIIGYKIETIIDNYRPKYHIIWKEPNFLIELEETINEIDSKSLLRVSVEDKMSFSITNKNIILYVYNFLKFL